MASDICAPPSSSSEPSWNATFPNGTTRRFGSGPAAFTFRVPTEAFLQRLLSMDPYSAALGYVGGEFDVDGDLAAAIRFKAWKPRDHWRRQWLAVLAWYARLGESVFQSKSQTARHIRFHYDRSNEFYGLFLDPRMVYSCAYFRTPDTPLEQAQRAKLDHICRKLDLQAGERFLDVGCGWGALVRYAAECYRADATGCTVSAAQREYALERASGGVRILEQDYRDLSGRFEKVASVGMFEHVGRRRAAGYFHKIAELLAPGGLFLNHAIARPQGVWDDAASLFVRRHIFPGGELIHLAETIRFAEEAGLEVLDVENLRPHYARTCHLWEQRLSAQHDTALKLVDEPTFRAWRLWLAASSLSFEDGQISVYQVLMGRRGAPRRHVTRDYMYLQAS